MSDTGEHPPTIDHPTLTGWQPDALQVMGERLKSILQKRYEAFGEDVTALWHAVDLVGMQLASYRLTHELDNLGRLQLTEPEQQTYQRLAGRPERFGTYIRWFGRVATECLRRDTHDYAFSSVALELAGQRQLGDWSATRRLDRAVRAIPDQVRLVDPRIAVARPAVPTYNYQLRPLYGDETYGYQFQYATLRRRQPVYDIEEHSYKPVRVYRQAIGLLVLSQLVPDARRSIVEAYEAAGPEHSAENNTPAAAIAGQVFERAITDRAARAIVPIGTQYIMRVMPETTQGS